MKKRIIITTCILVFGMVLVFLFVVLSDYSSIGWIHQLDYELFTHRKFEKKMNKMFSMLPQNVRESIDQDDDYQTFRQITDAITESIPDEVQRAVVAFRILGLDNLMLAGGSGWDSSFSKILDPISMSSKIKAFTIVQDEPEALKAASWWLFKHIGLVGYDNAYEKISEEHLKVTLPIATSYAMANWPKYEAHLAIKAISRTEGQTAKNLLRKIVAGQQTVSGGPSIISTKRPEMNCSPRALAALMLAQSGDMQSLEQIRELSKISEGNDKIVYNKSLTILTGSYEKKENE